MAVVCCVVPRHGASTSSRGKGSCFSITFAGAQCTPTRSALLTGRYAVRSGNHTVMLPGVAGAGLVAWERTLGDLFSEAGYATMCLGKWHVGEGAGRWPTDHGFDEWYGVAHTYDECLWFDDPWYWPGR